MKVVAISNPQEPAALLERAAQEGYVTFIFEHADPAHALSSHKFSYVRSDEELEEKINLLKADPSVVEEVARW
jgi:hypothetical protein